MKKITDTLREAIEFSEMHRAAEIRKLKAKGKSGSSVKVDAYSTVITRLSSILSKKDNKRKNSKYEER